MMEIKRGLGIRFLASFVIIVFLLTSAISVFAQDTKAAKGYTYNLKQLMEQAEKNIKKVDEDLKEKEIEKRNQQREVEAREHFEKGNALYKEGKLKEAKQAWQKALEVTQSAEMKDYIKDSAKRAKEEERVHRKEERERQKRLETERREKERIERERQKQLELEKKEQERRQKEEQEQLEVERRKRELEKKQTIKREIGSRYNKAISYYRDKSYDLAIQEFNKVLELSPQHKSAQDYLDKKIPTKIGAQEEAQRKAEETRLKKEKKERERLEKEKQRQLERQKKEQERKEKEERKRLEAENKKAEQEKLKAERIRQRELKKQQEVEKRRQEKLERERKIEQRKEATRLEKEKKEKERLERKRQKELEKQEREKQRQLERQKKEEEQKQKEEIRKKKRDQERLEKEKMKKSKKAIQDAKETVRVTEEETKIRLEGLTYKTEKECLDVLGKYPDDKEAFDNLVNLYLLKDELLDKAKELYKNKDYEGTIQEYNKVLLIEPENKKAKMGVKRTRPRVK